MGTQITFRRGENDPTSGSGLTLAEPAFNTTLKTFHIGLGYGVTAAWVGAPISGLSADIAAGITYKIPTAAAVKNYISTVGGVAGATGATGATGPQGEPGQSSNYYNYKVHTSSQTTPTTNGEIRYNNASQTGSTLLYIDHLDSNGDDIDVFLSLLKQNDNLIIQDANNSNNYQTWKITSAPTVILNDFTTIPVTGITSAGTGTSGFNDNHQVLFIVFSSPIATAYVESFNGLTGAVTGASLGANTFTGTQTLTAGLTTSYLYASTGSTFASTLQVNGGATFSGRTDFAGNNNFATGLTAAGTLNTTSNIKFNGTTDKSITTTQAPLTIRGMTSGGAFSNANSVVLGVQTTDPLQLNSATGVVEINVDNNPAGNPYTTGIKIFTGNIFDTVASVNIAPLTFFNADRTLNIQDASGTIALTSQLMGAINGSTAATTAVTSFNGRTGAVQGVSAAAAGDGIAVSGATGAVTITNTGVTRAVAGTGISVSGATGSVTITNIGVQSFNGNTGAVTGASLGANTFTGLQTMTSGISAAGGVTLAGTLQGTTANFTGLVSSTVGFSGAGTNLTGNASGLTAGTASKVQIAEAASASYYLALASGVGNTGIFVDTTVPRWLYNTSTGALTTTTGSVEAASLIATSTGMFSNTWEGFDGTTPMNIRGPYFDGTFQPIYIGDVNGDANGTLITIDDAANTVQISDNANLLARGATFSGNLEVKQHINMNWSGQGAATQLFTAKNSGGLKISHESGKRITIGSGGVADRETYISVTEDAAGVNNTGKIEFGWTRTDNPEADPVEYVSGNFVFPQSSGVTGDVLRVQSHNGDSNTSVLEWSAVTGVSSVNGFTGGITFAASTGITFTASAGTITLSTTGGGGSKTYAVYTPLDNQPPAANYATIDTRNSIMVLDFDAATDESAVFVGIMPEAASLGSGLKIRINWMATSATSGTCRWGVQIERMNTDEDSDSFDTAATAGSTTNATSGIITTTEITITTIDSVAAGDPFRIKVFRDADGTSGTDDMTGDAELVSVEVRSAA